MSVDNLDMSPAACAWCQTALAYNSVCRLHHDHVELRWKPVGFTLADYLRWAPHVNDPTAAAVYRQAGMDPTQAHPWHTTRLPAATAIAWYHTGLTPDQVTAWLNVRTVTSVADYQTLAAWHTPNSARQHFGAKQPFSLTHHRRGASDAN